MPQRLSDSWRLAVRDSPKGIRQRSDTSVSGAFVTADREPQLGDPSGPPRRRVSDQPDRQRLTSPPSWFEPDRDTARRPIAERHDQRLLAGAPTRRARTIVVGKAIE